jgi:hypothetical protein
MKILHIIPCLILWCSSATASIENSRDWAAFCCFNSDVNSWLRPGNDVSDEIKRRQVKLLFFQYWLMYFGPEAYQDDDAVKIRTFFEQRRKETLKKLDFVSSQFPELSGLNALSKLHDDKLVSVDFDVCTEVLRLTEKGLTAGRLRSIIKDFEKWLKGEMGAK